MLTLQLIIYANECSSDSQVRWKTINELLTMENVVTDFFMSPGFD